ncbi:hypothetical protein Hore_20000 [Halothermothrix orenii H 168]|uniref:Uncharacterized protein n=1 Tax=Halothermothrix orenii (strain H 168 / OCM 544 / DSM 9562) TaxID=373903 RepID=B8CZM8_HALOH|nr:hypothetical protein Hore_20000 [Halothermothrix orenii H 168]
MYPVNLKKTYFKGNVNARHVNNLFKSKYTLRD